MRVAGIFLLVVGCVWALFVAWLFVSIAAIADPGPLAYVVLYWGGLLTGPVAMILGSTIVLIGRNGCSGSILVAIGCLILTGFALYNGFAGMQRKPLQAPPTYSLYVVMLIIMVLADIAGFRVVRKLLGPRETASVTSPF